MKIRPAEAEFSHSDGQTDVTKLLTVAIRNFANSSKICHILPVHPPTFLHSDVFTYSTQ